MLKDKTKELLSFLTIAKNYSNKLLSQYSENGMTAELGLDPHLLDFALAYDYDKDHTITKKTDFITVIDKVDIKYNEDLYPMVPLFLGVYYAESQKIDNELNQLLAKANNVEELVELYKRYATEHPETFAIDVLGDNKFIVTVDLVKKDVYEIHDKSTVDITDFAVYKKTALELASWEKQASQFLAGGDPNQFAVLQNLLGPSIDDIDKELDEKMQKKDALKDKEHTLN